MKRTILSLLLALAAFVPASPTVADPSDFPRSAALEPGVRFWTRVYTEVSTSAGFIHDSRELGVVYETVSLPKGASSRTRERITSRAKSRIKQILLTLARGKRSGLSAEEKQVLARWPDGVSNATLRAAAGRLRFQLGQADKFRAGLARSGVWEPHIRETFTQMNLPVELAALPHVESSYTPHAYSRIGAAGLWQFTRSTGRRFMRVDHVVDERLDPWRATVAAARLLEQNRQTTGSWPLAITAYNHGAAGMRRAVRQLGTRDMATIIRKYKSRSFGFASRNFYLEFLAAADVDFHSEKYFGPILMEAPVEYETIALPYFTTARALQRGLGIDMSTLRASNPALRDSVWSGAKYVPREFTVRVPRSELARPLDAAIAAIPHGERHARQVRDSFHTIRRGETLSGISRRYGIRLSDLVALNGLRSRHRIRAGQKLRLPDTGGHTRLAAAHPAATVRSEPPSDGRYRVRRGDTITRIAARFGLDEQELIRSNGLRNRNRIYVGQELRLSKDPQVAAAPKAAPARTRAAVPAPIPTPAPAPAADPHPEASVALSAPAGDAITAEQGVKAAEGEAEVEGARLMADPSDYSVAPNGRIEVQAAETLGHFAEWLELRASRLRGINGLRYGEALPIGRPLKLDFSRVPKDEFERRRIEYHRGLQEEFFAMFEIEGTQVHVMRRGDSLWTLSQRKYQVPIWLLRQYNPDLDFGSLPAGARITIPLVRRHNETNDEAANPAPTTSEARLRIRG